MDVVIFVRDLDRGIPPIEIDQDLDATYNRLYCGKTTLQSQSHLQIVVRFFVTFSLWARRFNLYRVFHIK